MSDTGGPVPPWLTGTDVQQLEILLGRSASRMNVATSWFSRGFSVKDSGVFEPVPQNDMDVLRGLFEEGYVDVGDPYPESPVWIDGEGVLLRYVEITYEGLRFLRTLIGKFGSWGATGEGKRPA